MMKHGWVAALLAALLASAPAFAQTAAAPAETAPAETAPAAGAPAEAPFSYIWGEAFHVLPQTHNNESGYFSLTEGLDGALYVGTAKYGENAFLVEFTPWDERQRIVIDAHEALGLTDTGYAAQAKIHTRNFVGPSGRIYVGTKQGYETEEDKANKVAYRGGYVLVYDPRTMEVRSLGMPYSGEGVIDVAADEARQLLYAVTCESQHWMLLDTSDPTPQGFGQPSKYRELGPRLTRYATTLIDARGRAHAITEDFRLATYDAERDSLTLRDIVIDGQKLTPGGDHHIPLWSLAPDGRSAYLTFLDEAVLLSIDLGGWGTEAQGRALGKLVEGEAPDIRNMPAVAPDGKVYVLVRVKNATGFGDGHLHHLTRYDPAGGAVEDLGVLAVKNPDFFDFGERLDDHVPPWSHGYHRLPDGTLTPLHHHHALVAARDGTLYATVLYPFTLLKIDLHAGRDAEPAEAAEPVGPARRFIDFALKVLDRAEERVPELTRVAEVIAQRHVDGGVIGLAGADSALHPELHGRAGGIVHIGFDRPWSQDRTDAQKANDVAIISWEREPHAEDLPRLKELKARGVYIVGFGPRDAPQLEEHRALCDAYFDTGYALADRAVELSDGSEAGLPHAVINAFHGWALTAEVVAALTRLGKMPPMWMAYLYPEGLAWGDRYLGKGQFHDDYHVPPVAPGELARRFLRQARWHVAALGNTQMEDVEQAGELIADELALGRKTVVAYSSHMPPAYVGRSEDAAWTLPIELHMSAGFQVDGYVERTPDRALVLRLGYFGFGESEAALFASKRQRVLLAAAKHVVADQQATANLPVWVDLMAAFGDACVPIEGYPLRIIPPSGFMQAVAYEAINCEVMQRIAERRAEGQAVGAAAAR